MPQLESFIQRGTLDITQWISWFVGRCVSHFPVSLRHKSLTVLTTALSYHKEIVSRAVRNYQPSFSQSTLVWTDPRPRYTRHLLFSCLRRVGESTQWIVGTSNIFESSLRWWVCPDWFHMSKVLLWKSCSCNSP